MAPVSAMPDSVTASWRRSTHGIDIVPQVFEGLELRPDPLRGVPVPGEASLEHPAGKRRRDTAAAGGEAREFFVPQVMDDRLLAHTADDQRGIHQCGEFREEQMAVSSVRTMAYLIHETSPSFHQRGGEGWGW